MELKDRIIEEATRMFAEEGIKSVRMDDIATACGISKRTLYEIFSDREDVIRQSLRYHVQRYEKLVSERLVSAENVIDEFWILFGHGSGFREKNRIVMKDLVKFYPQIFEDFLRKHHIKVLEKNRERFERGQKEGLILKNIDAEFMSKNLTGYLYGLQKGFQDLDPEKWDTCDIRTGLHPHSFQFVIMLYFRGMATEKGRDYIDNNILKGIS